MSCSACDKAQGDDENPVLDIVSFVRVGKANVLISGCKEHLSELIRIFKLGLKANDDLRTLKLKARTTNTLVAAGVTTVSHLDTLTFQDFNDMPGFGIRMEMEVLDALDKHYGRDDE